ncbi:hypothetical protein ACIP93_35760 [Streptomyces sp. NPDC088745]|uniref:hypothetical protein n=1 Tax=Streptomyces sp. NPDC088745 TaxID=3365884 RepID=UPI0038065D06
MPRTQRSLLILSLLLVSTQIAFTAVYFFWFVPTFSGGIGPAEEPHPSMASSNRTTLLSLLAGGVIVALDWWGCRGILRSLRHHVPAARPLTAACTAQLLLTACAVAAQWLLPMTACLLAFALLTACLWYDRRGCTPATPNPHAARS